MTPEILKRGMLFSVAYEPPAELSGLEDIYSQAFDSQRGRQKRAAEMMDPCAGT